MSKLIALFTIFSILAGSCCTGALSVLASDGHHQNSGLIVSSPIHVDDHDHPDGNHHADQDQHEAKVPDHSNEPCDHNRFKCLEQVAINAFVEKLAFNSDFTAKKKPSFNAILSTVDLQLVSRRLRVDDRLQVLQSTKYPYTLALTARFRL